MTTFPASRVKRALVVAAVLLTAASLAVCLWLPGMNAGLNRRIEGAKQFQTFADLQAHMGVPPGSYCLHDRVTTLYPETHYRTTKSHFFMSALPGYRTAIWYTDKYCLHVVYDGRTGRIADCTIQSPAAKPFDVVQ